MTNKRWISLLCSICVGALLPAIASAEVSYADPTGGWAYLYTGDACATQFDACLDGKWHHYDAASGGSDAWDGSAPGQIGASPTKPSPGGAGIFTDGDTSFLRIQDCGDPVDGGWADPSNRKITFAHNITSEVTGGTSILNTGVTLSFRARIPTTAPLDPIYPDGGGGPQPWVTKGYNVHDDGYGAFGIKQGRTGLGIISFSLAMDSDEGDISGNGLTMNKRVGTAVNAAVDSYDAGGTENTLTGFDPTQWHEFWIQIVGDTSGGGTHKVTIWMDGDVDNPKIFHVTAGTKHEGNYASWDGYLVMSIGRTAISGSQDVDFFGYKAGLHAPKPARDPEQAADPSPANRATDVLAIATLGWTPGELATTHDVYLGTNFDDVDKATRSDPRGVLISQGQSATIHDPTLAYGQTYYWRIDEVGAAPNAQIFKGEIWSFTTEMFSLPITSVIATAASAQPGMGGPQSTVDGSGLNAADQHSTESKDMWISTGAQPNWIQYEFDQACKLHELWVWNSNQLVEAFVGFGAKDVTIEYSLDAATWTELPNVPEFAKATGQPTYAHNTTVDLGGVVAKYVKLTIKSSWGGLPTSGLSEVRFFYVPVQAREPKPANGAANVSLDAELTWRPGREAASHKVYFGKDMDAVANGTVAAQTVSDPSFSPAAMEYGQTYYWRVDEVNDAKTPSTYEGSVWSFTTQEFAIVDEMESYNDDDNRIYESWIDGVTDGKSGSTVGYFAAPFAEQTIIHGGKQSMPLAYDNTTVAYSEATLTFDGSQNWTASGIKSLSLYFRGAADNTGKLYLKINSTKVPYNGGADDIAKTAWLPWNIDLSTVSGNLSKVNTLVIGIEGSGAKGIVYIDDIRLYPKAPQFVTPTDPGTAGLLALYAFEGNANDTSGNKLNGAIKDGQLVASGRPNGGSALEVKKAGYADLGNPALLDFSTGDWTLAAWYKTAMTGTGDANKGTLVAKGGDTAGGHRYALIMSETTEGVLTLVTDDDVTKYVVNSTSKTNNDEWHFAVGQREGTALRIYIDGVLEGTGTATATYNLAGTKQHNAYIGASTDHTNNVLYKLYNGLIDEVRIYNKALSEGEILWLAGRTTPVAKPF